MRARLGTLNAAALLAGSCGEDSEESAPAAAAHASSHAVAHHQDERGELGCYEGPHDGVFGEDTHEALKALQADEGIEESGKLDRPTRAVLGAPAGNVIKSGGEPESGQPGF